LHGQHAVRRGGLGAVLFLAETTVNNDVSGVLATFGVQWRAQAVVIGANAQVLLAVAG
jgi:hypothetical protein